MSKNTYVSKHFTDYKLKKHSPHSDTEQFDSLTRLYTYGTFMNKAKDLLSSSSESSSHAFLLIDIDDFGQANDDFGLIFADTFLIELANRLLNLCEGTDNIIARYGADEFIMLIKDAPSVSYIQELVQYIHNIIRNIHVGKNKKWNWTGCIGVSIFPTNADSYDMLYQQANIALYYAKSHGKDKYYFYNEKLANDAVSELMHNKPSRLIPEAPFSEHSDIDMGLVANAIDILFGTLSSDTSIDMLFSLIGIKFNIDKLLLVKEVPSSSKLILSHHWTLANTSSFNTPGASSKYMQFATLLHQCSNYASNNIFVTSDIASSPATETCFDTAVFGTQPTALFQYSFSTVDGYKCSINAFINSQPHMWTRNETDTFTILFRLISNYVQRLHSQARISFVSERDTLTGLYNFTTFTTKADALVTSSPDKQYAIIYMDLHRFMLFNDTQGYSAGNNVLKGIASILVSIGAVDGLAARVNADKFVAIYEYSEENPLTDTLDCLIKALKKIKNPDGGFYKITPVIGVCTHDNNHAIIISVDRANIARKNIKDYKISNYLFFDENMHKSLLVRQEIENTMEDALTNEEFQIYYQPKINVETSKVIGAEALVRWHPPKKKVLYPDSFIPIFEENGFIVSLDYYMLDHVCKWLRKQLNSGHEVFPISVNFSRMHFSTGVLPQMLKKTLEKYDLPFDLIEIEITESALGSHNSNQMATLTEISKLGFKLSLDDFGAGLSSLNLLRDLPFDILKIDKEFLHSKTTTERERIVISNIVRMATDLKMDIVCEGVETKDHEGFLRQIGCMVAQGYYYEKPIHEDVFTEQYIQNSSYCYPKETI